MTEVEWYSPEWLIDAARYALGGAIDLDPASSDKANLAVRAARYYCREHNGLNRPWSGRVYCNPPHGREHNRAWLRKAADAAPGCKAMVYLCPAAANALWFQPAWESDAQAWFRGRPSFALNGTTRDEPRNDYVLLYWGPCVGRFADVYRDHATITIAIQSPLGAQRRLRACL
jgi:hypothetical protein